MPALRLVVHPARRKPMRRLSLTLLGSLAVLPPLVPAAAQPATATLPDTVITATRVPTPLDRIPAAVTVIDRQTIEERGYQTLAEALTAVPGMQIVPLGGPGQQTSAFLRGTSSRSVLVLLDGVAVNDPADPNGAFNFGNELLFDVERIEVVRGPASALYGSAALGGVINLITRRAVPDRPFAPYGELAGGTERTLRAGLGASGTLGAFDYLVSGQSLSTRGFNATAPRLPNIGERDGFRGYAATVRLGWTPIEGTRIEALLRWRQNNFGLDNVPRDDPNYSGEDRRWYGQLRGETRLLGGAWTTGFRISATEDRRRFTNFRDALSPASTDDYYRGVRETYEWTNTVRLPGFGPLTNGALAFGLTHSAEEVATLSGTTGFFTTRVNASQHTTAGYANLQYRLWERLDLTGGVRQDATTGFTDATTWRVGAVLALPEINSRLRVAAGTAFSAPSLYQRFGVIQGFFRGNPDLRPERSIAWEFGGETDLNLPGQPRFATGSWTFFQSRVRDLINFNNQFSSLANIDRARIHGAELGLTIRPAPYMEATAAWTITESIDAATGLRLARRPEHVVSVTGRLAPPAIPKLTIAPTLRFVGRSPENAFAAYDNNGRSIPYRTSNPAGVVVNLTVNYQAWERIGLFLEARNLGDRKFEPANGFVTPGRSVLFGTRFAL
jgi:vitamin B12 transporter